MSGTNRYNLSMRLSHWLRTVATYDVFPKFSAKVRRLFYNPLGVLILAALAALLCGAFLHRQGFVLCGSVLAVILLGVAWPWLSMQAVRGSISFDRLRAVEGEQVEASLTLTNRLPWAAYGLAVRAALEDQTALPVAQAASLFYSIASAPRRGTIRCRWWFTPVRRGVYPLAAPLLSTGFPFGLWENKRTLLVEGSLLVWPRTFPVGPVPALSGDQQVEGNVSRTKVGTSGDVLGVRPYRRGDSPRRIHWSQSARHDRLIVCELQANARPVIQLVLDADPSAHVGHGPDSSREWAIRIVASLAKGWLAAGVEVGSAWNGQIIPAASGPKQLNVLLDSLAKLPDTGASSFAETLAGPICRNFTNGLQLIVTTDVGAERSEVSRSSVDLRRWVILQTQGFLDSSRSGILAASGSGRDAASTNGARLQTRPWLLIDGPDRVPSLLRGGGKETQHGP